MKFFFRVFMAAFFSLFFIYQTVYAEKETRKNVFTLEAHGQPLQEIIKTISQLTGYTIKINEKCAQVPVSGRYTQTSVEAFFVRVLRDQNITITFDESEQAVYVRYYGEKPGARFIVAKGNLKNVLISEQVDPLIGLTLGEIESLHAEQQEAFMEYSENPESVEPIIGMKLGDIRDLHAQQLEEFKEYSEDSESLDYMTGLKLGDISALHQQQNEEFRQHSNNPEFIDPQSGRKNKEIRSLLDRQREVFKNNSENLDTIDPMVGMTLKEIRALHDKQEKAFLSKN